MKKKITAQKVFLVLAFSSIRFFPLQVGLIAAPSTGRPRGGVKAEKDADADINDKKMN